MARIAAASVALASVTALAVAGEAGVAERASVADSLTVLGHLHWLWIPAALLLEFASMAAFAIMLRRMPGYAAEVVSKGVAGDRSRLGGAGYVGGPGPQRV